MYLFLNFHHLFSTYLEITTGGQVGPDGFSFTTTTTTTTTEVVNATTGNATSGNTTAGSVTLSRPKQDSAGLNNQNVEVYHKGTLVKPKTKFKR